MTYWQRRQKEQLKALEKSEKALMQRLTEYYRDEYAKLDKEIASFYSKYGAKKIIEYRMLLEDLPPQDRSLLIKNVEEFKEKYPNLKHIVPVRENIYKLNRLEGLQLSIIMQQAEIGAVNEQAVRRHLENLALKNANSVAELLGFGKNFYFENSDIIKNFVGVKWCNGKDFSQRIWENTDKLARYLTTDLAQGFARGESYEKLTTQIGKRFIDVAKRDIYRLVYTEGTYIMAESSAKPFENDFESYRLSTVGDGKVCPICTSVAENVFRFADREPGVNFPPMHPMCRCTFEIVVDDWNKWLDDYEKKHSDSGKQLMNRLNSVDNFEKNSIIITGARIIDVYSDAAEQFAKMYYLEVKSFKTDTLRISENTGKSKEDINKIKEYLFCNNNFVPDCAIAHSWQRLIDGKNIKKHDLILIEHELYEIKIKEKNPNLSHLVAHHIASNKYNYQRESDIYYGNLKKRNKKR